MELTLGEKIKKARLDSHMTQREVVGDYITRNMLSKIENNSATPSMKTLEFLATQLGLPAGYFISGDAVEVVPQTLQAARQSYADGDIEAALTALEQSKDIPTDESRQLLALCHLRMAEVASRSNDGEIAVMHADAALRANAQTLYANAAVEASALLTIARFSDLRFDDAMAQFRAAMGRLGLERQYHLTMAQRYLTTAQPQQAAAELAHLDDPEDQQAPDYLWLQGELSMRGQDYPEAAAQLRRAERLAAASGCGEEALSPLYALLEECYREMDDYKTAYYYAAKQIRR